MNKELTLSDFYGKYKWFWPTDICEAPFWEITLIIDEFQIKGKRATWIDITKFKVKTSGVRQLTSPEIMDKYPKLQFELIQTRIAVFQIWITFLIFRKNPKDSEFGVIVKWNQSMDQFWPTILFNPEQIKRGVYQRYVDIVSDKDWIKHYPTFARKWKAIWKYEDREFPMMAENSLTFPVFKKN